MSGIWKINMVQNLSTKQDFNKLTFKKGDSFVARVLKLDGNTSEVILRLLDGRTFPAKIEGAVNGPLDNYLLKFLVDSFEDGKLNIKILEKKTDNTASNKEQNQDDLLKDFMGRVKFAVQKEDVGLLKAMIKFNIPLNEENFKEIKSFSEFINKISSSPEEENQFIEKYLNSKGIESESIKGQAIKETLKNFFSEAKKLDLTGFLMLKESNIPLTEENINSFNRIVSPEMNVFKDLEQIRAQVEQLSSINIGNNTNTNTDGKILDNKTIAYNQEVKNGELNFKENILSTDHIYLQLDKSSGVKATTTNFNEIENYGDNLTNSQHEIIRDEADSAVRYKEAAINDTQKDGNKVLKQTITENGSIKPEDSKISFTEVAKNSLQNSNDIESLKNLTSLKNQETELLVVKSKLHEFQENSSLPTDTLVKEEIKDKLSGLKSTLLDLLKFTEENNLVANKVFQSLEGKFQEFKMFNTLNNDYYYLNIPMNIRDDEYDCKLVIRDERAKGKKIDSKNIKIATSISTVNMNTVDAYITVLNNSVSVKIEAEKNFVKLLDLLKDKLFNDLGDDKHIFNILVEEKKQVFSLSNCREFFSDDDFTAINAIV